jgi:OmcA/MtrC family decaheme c-type cytochrome
MRKPVLTVSVLGALLGLVALGSLMSFDQNRYTPLDKRFYLSSEEAIWVRPGLNLEIQKVTIPANLKPVITYKITDDKDQPLDQDGVFTPGTITPRFILAYLPADDDQYVNYVVRNVTSPITGETATQAATDSGGTFTSRGDGIYDYTFGTTLPVYYDRTATHTLGVYATRDLREYGLGQYVANAVKDFVPDGRPATKIREIVLTENCNQCHNPLALHGGSRQDTHLCVLCHQPQSSDPDTGNTVDFKVMVHKIHMGENLPSVKAGKPYQIIGFGQSVHDFSEVAFPRDVRSCDTCHKNARQGEHFKEEPTRATCGSCHDDTNFNTGENHLGGPQPDDKYCEKCHWPESDREYDTTIVGAHTPPYRSKQLARPKFEVLDLANAGPGQKPTVMFKISDKDGNALAPGDMARIALRLAGPTSDYRWFVTESASNATYADGVATYTFTEGLPDHATGTYSLGIEGYVNTVLNPGTTKEFAYRDAGDNVLKLFAVTGAVTPRREVVDIAKCNRCHEKLQLHGNNRNQTDYCVGCHNPTQTDVDRRPESESPPQGIHFKVLVHRIHTGHDLEGDFTVYGFGNSRHNYNELHFPGDRRWCLTCHVESSYTLPLPAGLLPTTDPRAFWDPMQPVAAACLGCHDSIEAAAHAYLQTAPFGESCVVCHKEGAEFAVTRVHAR